MKKIKGIFFITMILVYLGIFVGLSFTILSYILGVHLSLLPFELTIWIFSVGLAIISLSFAALSICISKKSSEIANKSDEKMKSISTADFYEISYRFWDRAPILYRKQSFGDRDTYSWQLGNLFRHGEKLKKWADPDVLEKLIKEFKIFLTRLRPTPCPKFWVEIKNYIQICKIAIDFKTENDDIKNELIDELGEWIGKKEEGESNQEYLQRKSNEFSKMKKSDIFEMN